MADFRRLALFVTIGSFSVAALMGVLALLGGGDFGEGEGRVLLTTLLVGVTSIALLSYLATTGSAYIVVGVVGAVCALPTLLTGLVLVWSDGSSEEVWLSRVLEAFGVGSTVSATLAQASLLLVLAAKATPLVRRLLAATLAAATWVAVHVSFLIIEGDATDGSLRLLGIIAILDVLGTVAVAAMAKFGRGGAVSAPLTVPADLVPLLLARAEEGGRDPEATLRALIEQALEVPSA